MKGDDVASFADELVAIRRDFHSNPELAFEEKRTSGIVARLLGEWGYRVETGIGGTGVVGTLSKGSGSRSIGIRADMDALPIRETTGLPYASRTPGRMHACGHDGHTTMLLGTARGLARNPTFDGTVHLIFQPAEEDIGGARRMMDDGLFARFPCDAVFALHNLPGLDVGRFLFREGPIMAAVDIAKVLVKGRGGHGAMPHLTADPVVATAAMVTALQTIVSRNVDPLEEAVISVGILKAGDFPTVIPAEASLEIAVRSCSRATRDLLQRRIEELAVLQARSFDCSAEVVYERGYPVTVNNGAQCRFARRVAVEQVGDEGVRDLSKPMMISEDFAFMLEERPGCYFFVGNGPSSSLHDSGYDFNDAAIVPGVRYWLSLVDRYFST